MEDLAIAKLELKAGDILVIKASRTLSTEMALRIREGVTPKLPAGVQLLVIDQNIELQLLSAEEIREREAMQYHASTGEDPSARRFEEDVKRLIRDEVTRTIEKQLRDVGLLKA